MTRDTQREAYKAILSSGKLPEKHKLVYKALHEQGDMTQGELDSYLADQLPVWTKRSSRLSELRAMCLVEEAGTRECKITGMQVIVWSSLITDPASIKPLQKKVGNKRVNKALKAVMEHYEETGKISKNGFQELRNAYKEKIA